jgi:hypothetical protein
VEPFDPLGIERLLLVADEVRPLERPHRGELRTLKQFVHEPFPLAFRVVRDEGPRLLGGRQDSEQIEIDPTQEDVILRQRSGVDLKLLQPGEDRFIDEVVHWRIAPGELLTLGATGDPDRELAVEIPHEHRHHAGLLELDDPLRRDVHERIARLVDRQPGDVPLGAVREVSGHVQGEFRLWLPQDGILRRHFQMGDDRSVRVELRQSPFDPVREDLMFRRVRIEPLSPFVGNVRRRFEENEAFVGDHPVDPPAGDRLHKLLVVEVRVFAPQREEEAPLAVDVPVAGPGVAARLGEDRHHVPLEGDRLLSGDCTRNAPAETEDRKQHATQPGRKASRSRAGPGMLSAGVCREGVGHGAGPCLLIDSGRGRS